MKDRHWITELRKRMADYEESAPDDLWDSIEMTLSNGHRRISHKQHILRLWHYIGAIAAIVIFVLIFNDGLFFDGRQAVRPDKMHNKPSTQAALPQNISTPRPIIVRHSAKHAEIISKISEDDVSSDDSGLLPKNDIPISKHTQHNDSANGTPIDSAYIMAMHETRQPNPALLTHSSQNNKKNGRLSFGLSISNQPLLASDNQGYGGIIAGYATNTTASHNSLPDANNPLCELMRNNIDKEVYTRTKHYRPIKAGISICYNLSDRLALESGVTYACLMSSSISGSDACHLETEQKLHYIGLPIGLNYALMRNRRFSLYISADVCIEKCISGRINTDYLNYDVVTHSDSEHFRPGRPQWSANIGAGIQYDIARSISLYAEPGMSCYFKNGDSHETFYTQKRMRFNLEAGIRLSFGKNGTNGQ